MRDLRGKTVLLLEGTLLTKMIVDGAHDLGMRIVIANWYSVEEAPAKAFADASYNVNIFDIPAMLEIIRKEKVDGIFTAYTDSHLDIYRRICEAANLPCFTREGLVDIMVNKALFKDACRAADLPVIEEYDAGAVLSGSVEPVYPLIIKPADNSGARGISVCYDRSGFESAVERALEYSSGKRVIVERYLRMEEPGDEYCLADFWIQNGKVVFVASSDKTENNDNTSHVNLPGSYVFPSKHEAEIRSALENVQRFIDHISYKNGLLCFELIRSRGKIYIIEAQFRYGAKFQEIFLKREYGFDELEQLLKLAVYGEADELFPADIGDRHFSNSYVCMNILLRDGTIGFIQPDEEVFRLPNVDFYVPMFREGKSIKSDGSMVQRFGKVALSAPSRELLLNAMRSFQGRIQILDTNGDSMIIKSIGDAFD